MSAKPSIRFFCLLRLDVSTSIIKRQSHCVFADCIKIFGNDGNSHLEYGTGAQSDISLILTIKSNGLDINQPMLDIAETRLPPKLSFSMQDMAQFSLDHQTVDLITCFLYSIHYTMGLKN